jgi:lysophospholipase L1-like esterase
MLAHGNAVSPPTYRVGENMRMSLLQHLLLCLGVGSAVVCGQEPAQAKDSRPVVVAFGDSTTALRPGLTVYGTLIEKALAERGANVRVVNAGVNGSTTVHARQRFEKDVIAQTPRIAIVQFGINDSFHDVHQTPPRDTPRVPLEMYKENLAFFIDELRKRDVRVILMTPNLLRWTEAWKQVIGKQPYRPEDPDGFNVTLKPYVAAVRDLARERKVELVDVYAAYEAFSAKPGHFPDELLLDGIHPNQQGQQLVADALLELLSKPDKLRR